MVWERGTNMPTELETPSDSARRQKIEKYAKYGLAALACFLVSPIIFGVIQGAIGLILLAAIGLGVINFAPVFAVKIANWKLKALKNEAAKNPIETMQNIYADNMRTIAEKDHKIASFEGRLENFKDKMDEFAKKYPGDMVKFQAAAQKLNALLTRQKQKQKTAKLAAKQYAEQIDRGNAIWQMACEMHGLQELAGDMEKQVFQNIMKEVAFDSITHSFNTAVAELSIEADTEPDFDLTKLGDGTIMQALPESVSEPMPTAKPILVESVKGGRR